MAMIETRRCQAPDRCAKVRSEACSFGAAVMMSLIPVCGR